jgi:uncharacterized protein (TIGR03435 family)
MTTATAWCRALLIVTAASASLPAQQVQPDIAAAPAFEVVSVKPNKGGSLSSGLPFLPNGGFNGTNVALKSVIAIAYEVRAFQVEGGPDWLNSERFDIVARAPEGTPDGQRPAMLRTLLADRFKLVARFETREQPVYALVLNRRDGRLGSQLKPAAPCSPAGSARSASSTAASQGLPPCGQLFTSVRSGAGTISGRGMSLDAIASALANAAFREPVINRTGLSGQFDFELQFSADMAPGAATTPQELPSIFAAVQEQLGLKLQSERGPVRVLVIDSVERPTPN